jgi:hypothetical protein
LKFAKESTYVCSHPTTAVCKFPFLPYPAGSDKPCRAYVSKPKGTSKADSIKINTQKLASQQLFLKQLQAEKSPERQKIYALLEDKELCKKLMSLSIPDESTDLKALRQYFTHNPSIRLGWPVIKRRSLMSYKV